VLFFIWWAVRPAFFRGEVLNRDTPTLVPEDIGTPVGLFGIEPDGHAPHDAVIPAGDPEQPEPTSP